MFRALMRTPGDFSMFLVRIGLALSIFPHGAEKVGLLGDGSMDDSLKMLAQATGFPEWTGYLAIAAEFLGAIALFFGFFGRVAALGIGITMAVAAWKTGLGGHEQGPELNEGTGRRGLICRSSGSTSPCRPLRRPPAPSLVDSPRTSLRAS